MTESETIGQRIAALRRAHDWSLGMLAQKSGLTKSYLGRLEKGIQERPSNVTLEKLARAFGLSVGALISGPLDEEGRDYLSEEIVDFAREVSLLPPNERDEVLRFSRGYVRIVKERTQPYVIGEDKPDKEEKKEG